MSLLKITKQSVTKPCSRKKKILFFFFFFNLPIFLLEFHFSSHPTLAHAQYQSFLKKAYTRTAVNICHCF